MPNVYRRNVLKGISLTGIAVLAPMSHLLAQKPDHSQHQISMYLDKKHGRFNASTSNEIINTGDRAVVLKTGEPVGYRQLNGKNLAFYVNSSEKMHVLQPGERFKVHARTINFNPPSAMLIQNHNAA